MRPRGGADVGEKNLKEGKECSLCVAGCWTILEEGSGELVQDGREWEGKGHTGENGSKSGRE